MFFILFSRLPNVPIDHVFASPFYRTIETASGLLAQRNEENSEENHILIKPEAAFFEVFYFL